MLISHSSNARFRIDVFCFCCCFEFFRTILPWLFTLRVCEHTRARCCSAIVMFLTFQHSFFRSSQPYKCAGVHDSQTACVLMHSAVEYVCYKCRNKTLRHYTMQSINQVYGVRNNNKKKSTNIAHLGWLGQSYANLWFSKWIQNDASAHALMRKRSHWHSH